MLNSSNDAMVSAIVVVGQRNDDLQQIVQDYWQALDSVGRPFELIVVLDGHKPDALEALNAARQRGLNLKIVRLARAFGESTALMSGFDLARGEIILTLPAYYQVAADAIPVLLQKSAESDMVVAKRNPRRGNRFEQIRRRVFHRLLGSITGMRFSDLGCSVRLMDRRVLEEIRLYGDQHRFFAALARHAGFKVKEVSVPQSEKDVFRSRYRIRDYLHRLLDLSTVFFLIRFTKKPLRLFGMIGGIPLVIGGLILGILIVERLFFDVALADRPAMLLSSLLIVLGLQLISLGLLGELIIFTHAISLKEYKIEQIIGGDANESLPPKRKKSAV